MTSKSVLYYVRVSLRTSLASITGRDGKVFVVKVNFFCYDSQSLQNRTDSKVYAIHVYNPKLGSRLTKYRVPDRLGKSDNCTKMVNVNLLSSET